MLIGFFQLADIYYVDKKEKIIKKALEESSEIMWEFKGLSFNVDIEYSGEFFDLVKDWQNKHDKCYFMTQKTFLKELLNQCLRCHQMKLYGIFEELLKESDVVIIARCGTVSL